LREPWGGFPYKIDKAEVERKGNEMFMVLETGMLDPESRVAASSWLC
jgi:hypothetical protein